MKPEQHRIILVGRPNSGKSSLYNALTGGQAHVGNYPGVTVDILEGDLDLLGTRVTLLDLPGLYSITRIVDPETDEGVARVFLEAAKADPTTPLVVNVIDVTQLALSLRLTHELIELGMPMIVVLTQSDLLDDAHKRIDRRALSEAIGVPVVLASARDKSTLPGLLQIMKEGGSRSSKTDFDVDSAVKAALLPGAHRRESVMDKADSILLHPLLGPIAFGIIMTALFAAVFLVADPATSLMDTLVGYARAAITDKLGTGLIASFLSDGVLGGAGTVLAFMPQIVILTIAMEVLEASGYLARGAFLTDRLLRLLGLSGYSFLPLLMGHACAVPAIASTRVIRDPKERLTTILILPLMTCSARLPTYALIISAFFSHRGPLFRAALFVALYLFGVLAGLAASFILRRKTTKGKGLPLVLEMPSYRVPQLSVVVRKAILAARRFIKDVGTTIVVASTVLWILLTVPLPGSHAPTSVERSVAANVGRVMEPVTRPAGFDWRINVGLIGSFGARELMVGTLGVIFGVEGAQDHPAPLTERLRTAKTANGDPVYTVSTGLSVLIFFVFACQCMSTVAAIRRETRSLRWPLFVLGYTYIVGFAASVLVYQVSRLFLRG